MATLTAAPTASANTRHGLVHRFLVSLAALTAASFVAAIGIYGAGYYRSSLEERALSPLHAQLRSSGTIGLKLGMLGVGLFAIIFLYPLRKRARFLTSAGTTRHWLDFHVIAGITAPIVITYHSAFHTQGIAGLAYWIMIAVALSGFIGRYVYAQIPRNLSSVSLTVGELEAQSRALSDDLARQTLVRPEDLAALSKVPTTDDLKKMNMAACLGTLLRADLERPFLIARLRRHALQGSVLVPSFGGLLTSRNADLEAVIAIARRQARLTLRMALLDRTGRIFHLWHVIHRPFSLSFVALIAIHIAVVLLLGYY